MGQDRKFTFAMTEAEANALWRAVRKREAEQLEKMTNALRDFQNAVGFFRNQHMRLPHHLVTFLRGRWNACGIDIDWLEENPADFITAEDMFTYEKEQPAGK